MATDVVVFSWSGQDSEPTSCSLGYSVVLAVELYEALPPVIRADVPIVIEDAVYHEPVLVQESVVVSKPDS